MLTNCIYLFFHRRIPFCRERRLRNCFVTGWIDPILVIIRDTSCSIDRNHNLEFLIFESQLCTLCQCIIPSAVSATMFSRRLPCVSNWCLKASQFSWLLLALRRILRWIIVYLLLCLTFSWLLLNWLCGFRFLLGRCGFHNDISVEVLIQHRFICSIQHCVPLSSAKCIFVTRSLQECRRGCGV